MNVFFDHAEAQADRIATLWFRPEWPFRFIAGQYVEFYLPHATADDRGLRRWFTLTTIPGDELIAITTKFPTASSSYKRALRALKPGDQLSASEPLGDFVLPKDPSIPLVFVAAGTGCAPYASMVKWLINRREQRDISLIYGATAPGDFVFTDTWKSYPLRYIPIVSQPGSNWHGQVGTITTTSLLALLGDLGNKLVYLAGPQSLVEPLYDELLGHIPRSQLLLDYFPGY